ncbi:Allophanate hydrolase, subunit 1 [Croceitalea dokdonensis DOKDO 023]|uniref:Allophanate hydrolase, subunit 1 n=1 Tax=Croceitalea dokdonensis DOKDO 023 TaxID=1300341 RepID=A0A0P7B2E4_9FLAO|nr:5-oxoprolinase subunit PxpB [Croceitalea dokdonensis]KPM33575.1 Allophanate hydrolase, subunit 1 [Croceitalea dokdonensis DOKDO 023]
MKKYPITIKPFGLHAALIAWPDQVNEGVLEDILQFKHFLMDALEDGWELIPAYNSLTLVNTCIPIDENKFHGQLLTWYKQLGPKQAVQRYQWTLPVCYDSEFGHDIQEVASTLTFSVDELITKHTATAYTVYGIGFLPGFMYLGGLPKDLEIPRKQTPRLHVDKGSVGLAGKQTGIYPQDSPGGWNIIGRCPIPLFNTKASPPFFASIGDKIRFKAVSKAEYDLHKIEGEVGIYQPEKKLWNA